MKTNSFRFLLTTFALTGGLLLGDSARAAVTGINSPAGSYAWIIFDDTSSLNPSLNPGGLYNHIVAPWGGALTTLPLTTDPNGDFAQGNITANVVNGNYSIALNNVSLSQAAGNTGSADLRLQFYVEFQLDSGGLLSQPIIFPTFAVNGTINGPGDHASFGGTIDYWGGNPTGTNIPLGHVNYNALFNTPGNFSATVAGVPVNGNTPTIAPNTTLSLVGNFFFGVDPGNISLETVPEPGSGLLLGFAGLSGLLWLLMKQRRSRSTAQ